MKVSSLVMNKNKIKETIKTSTYLLESTWQIHAEYFNDYRLASRIRLASNDMKRLEDGMYYMGDAEIKSYIKDVIIDSLSLIKDIAYDRTAKNDLHEIIASFSNLIIDDVVPQDTSDGNKKKQSKQNKLVETSVAPEAIGLRVILETKDFQDAINAYRTALDRLDKLDNKNKYRPFKISDFGKAVALGSVMSDLCLAPNSHEQERDCIDDPISPAGWDKLDKVGDIDFDVLQRELKDIEHQDNLKRIFADGQARLWNKGLNL